MIEAVEYGGFRCHGNSYLCASVCVCVCVCVCACVENSLRVPQAQCLPEYPMFTVNQLIITVNVLINSIGNEQTAITAVLSRGRCVSSPLSGCLAVWLSV